MADDGAVDLAPLRVTIDFERAARFARETGFLEEPIAPPLSYPAIWLSEPSIRAAIAQICAEADSLPVHESQRFDYEAPLRFGAEYDLALSWRRQASPPRLALDARLTLDGAPIGRFATLLRLVPRASLAQGDAA